MEFNIHCEANDGAEEVEINRPCEINEYEEEVEFNITCEANDGAEEVEINRPCESNKDAHI